MEAASRAALQLGFDDEAASTAFSKLFAVTKDVKTANEEMAIAMDLARYKNISLEEASQKLLMVHAGATKELKALGIAVEDGATVTENLGSIMAQVSGQAETFGNTSKGAMEKMQVSLGNIQESIGAALQPAITSIITAIQPVIEKFSAWAEENPKLVASIMIGVVAIAGIVAALGTLGLVLPSIIAGVAAVGAVIAALMSPVILIVAGLALLTYAVVTNRDKITKTVNEAVDILADALVWLANDISSWIVNTKQMISDWVVSVVQFFSDLVTQTRDRIQTFGSNLIRGIADGVT